MKKIFLLIITAIAFNNLYAQDFKTDITTARSSYAKGDLADAHYALEQALQEIDITIGKEVLKLLPAKMGDMSVNMSDDNVYANAGFIGTTIHRSYGTTRKADLSIISNSPLVATINAFLNTPMLGGMMSDGTTKMVKVQGYKSQLQKEANSDGTNNYTISLPLGNSLVTFKVDKTTDTEILSFANTLPLEAIAKLIQ